MKNGESAGKVVDSKRVTPAIQADVHESKSKGRDAAVPAAAIGPACLPRPLAALIDEVCGQFGYSRKHTIKLLGTSTGWGAAPSVCKGPPAFEHSGMNFTPVFAGALLDADFDVEAHDAQFGSLTKSHDCI